MQYSSKLGALNVDNSGGQKSDRYDSLVELSLFLSRFSEAVIYLEIINQSIDPNMGGLSTLFDDDEFKNTVTALFNAFFLCSNLGDDDTVCWNFQDVRRLLKEAGTEIYQLASEEKRAS